MTEQTPQETIKLCATGRRGRTEYEVIRLDSTGQYVLRRAAKGGVYRPIVASADKEFIKGYFGDLVPEGEWIEDRPVRGWFED